MKAIKRIISLIIVLIMLLSFASIDAFAAIRQFDGSASGSGTNLQRPRGYYVALTDGSRQWLASKFVLPSGDKNQSPSYSGVDAGLSYVDAEDVSEIRALVSNGIQSSADCINFVMGFYKKSASASMSSLSVGTLVADSTGIPTPDGGANKWCIRFSTLKLESGTYYEFAYMCGLYANNGGTCVVSEDETGYLAFDNSGQHTFNSESETAWYNSHKSNEFYYPNWTKNGDGSYTVNYLPFRYHIQTYADVSKWEAEAQKVQKVVDSTGNEDLASLLANYNAKVSNVIKYELQTEADKDIATLISSIEAAMNKKPTDFTEYKATLSEAKTLYSNTKNKVGSTKGKYGATQVQNLLNTINDAEAHVGTKTAQSDVDSYTTKLKQAIALVKASKVTEDEIVFYDSSTGITVTAKNGALPSNVKLYVAQVATNDTIYDNVKEKSSSEISDMIIYVIKFYANNKEVTPSSSVKIQIPVISSISAEKTSVYLLSSNGTQKHISSSLANGIQVFSTSSVGYFGILEFSSGSGGNTTDKKESILVEDDNTKGNEINEVEKKEAQGEEVKDREMKDAEKSDDTALGIDLSDLSNDIDGNTIRYVGIGVAGFGIFCGVIEFIRSKREKDLFV